MNFYRFLLPLFLVTLLGACATAPPMHQPIKFNPSESFELYRSPLLDQTNHTLQHLNKNKDIVYYQTYGGGGVGVGVMFGPLGVAANIKMIESNTMKDVAVLKDKISLDPNKLFMRSATKSGVSVQSGGTNKLYKLNPYVLVEKTENDVIMMASVVLVDYVGSKNKYQGRYLVQLPVSYSVAELASLDAVKSSKLESLVEEGFASLLSRMKAEATANVELEQSITSTSEFLTPRFKFEIPSKLIEKNEAYTWIRTSTGVFGVRNNDIAVKVVGQKTKPKKADKD